MKPKIMHDFKCKKCLKKINETPYYEVHEWRYDDHGTLVCTSDFYCPRCFRVF